MTAIAAVFTLAIAPWMLGASLSDGLVQGNVLAQCSTALLVAASATWIRRSKARYRQVVSHIPAVLYSAREPAPIGLLSLCSAVF